MSDCCPEPTCTRLKPMVLMRDDKSQIWYIVTAYNEKPDTGQFIPYQKHALPEDAQSMLSDMFYAQFWLLTMTTALNTSPKGLQARLGLDPDRIYNDAGPMKYVEPEPHAG